MQLLYGERPEITLFVINLSFVFTPPAIGNPGGYFDLYRHTAAVPADNPVSIAFKTGINKREIAFALFLSQTTIYAHA